MLRAPCCRQGARLMYRPGLQHCILRVACTTLAIAIMACSGATSTGSTVDSPSAQAPQLRDRIVVRLWDNPQGFDPATLFRVETENVAFNIYSGLTTYDPQSGAIVPDLAERYDTADAQTYTFNLRHGVKWQGGYGDLTSADVL